MKQLGDIAGVFAYLSLLTVGGGAQVIYGNLIVLPVGNSFLYVEPLFVQANNGKFPELQRVILATQDKIAMSNSFPSALNALFGSAPVTTQPGPSPTPGPSATPAPSGSAAAATIAQLVKSASDHYANAQAALKNGDFATYGQELKALEADLARLRALTGQ